MKQKTDVQKFWDSLMDNSMTKLTEDKRGTVYRVKIKNFGFNVIYTKRGGIRAADSHPNVQYDLVLKGKLEIWLKKKNKILKLNKGKSNLIIIPPNIPHLFISLEDSLMIEWWNGKFKQKFDPDLVRYIEGKFGKQKMFPEHKTG
jgi:quercetin dioxygenase-like cupin family protein